MFFLAREAPADSMRVVLERNLRDYSYILIYIQVSITRDEIIHYFQETG